MTASLEVSTALAPDEVRTILTLAVQVAQTYDREYLVILGSEPGTFDVRSDRVLVRFAVEITADGAGRTSVRSRVTDPDPSAGGRGRWGRREKQPEGYAGYADFVEALGNIIAISDAGASVHFPAR